MSCGDDRFHQRALLAPTFVLNRYHGALRGGLIDFNRSGRRPQALLSSLELTKAGEKQSRRPYASQCEEEARVHSLCAKDRILDVDRGWD